MSARRCLLVPLIYRVERDGDYEVYADGFTNVTDLAFGHDGSLYVVEYATNGIRSTDPTGAPDTTGALKRVPPDGSDPETIASKGLDSPYGVTVSRKGKIYVTNHGSSKDAGEVVRVDTGG